MKKKIMMLGIHKLTMVFDGKFCDVSIFNRKNNKVSGFTISDGVVREKPKQTNKVDKKVFIRACAEYRKVVTLWHYT